MVPRGLGGSMAGGDWLDGSAERRADGGGSVRSYDARTMRSNEGDGSASAKGSPGTMYARSALGRQPRRGGSRLTP